jgi:hypothetical protein
MAYFDRYTGNVDWNILLPMDGIQAGTIYDFLSSAAEGGWELCASFPSATRGEKAIIAGIAGVVEYKDSADIITLIFKRST